MAKAEAAMEEVYSHVVFHSELKWLKLSKLMPSFLALLNERFSNFFHRSSRSLSRFLSLKKKEELETIQKDKCSCMHSLQPLRLVRRGEVVKQP